MIVFSIFIIHKLDYNYRDLWDTRIIERIDNPRSPIPFFACPSCDQCSLNLHKISLASLYLFSYFELFYDRYITLTIPAFFCVLIFIWFLIESLKNLRSNPWLLLKFKIICQFITKCLFTQRHITNTSPSPSCFNWCSGSYSHDNKNEFSNFRLYNHISHHPKENPRFCNSLIVRALKVSELPLKIALCPLHKFWLEMFAITLI